MVEIVPTGSAGQITEFAKRECPCCRETRVMPGHRLTKNCSSEQVDPDLRQPTAPEISDQGISSRKPARAPEQGDRFLFAEVMQGEREENDVVGMFVAEMMNVRAVEVNFGKVGAQFSRDLDRCSLEIDRVDHHFSAVLAREFNHQPRDIAGGRGQIKDAQLVVRPDPAPEEMANQPMAAEVAI